MWRADKSGVYAVAVTNGKGKMTPPLELRASLGKTLDHVEAVFGKLTPITGPTHKLRPPDFHKLSEGLFLSAWSHWEEFCREVMIVDIATMADSVLRKEIKKFRTKQAPFRVAERIANHPDHPERFVEWHNYDALRDWADSLLGPSHRFTALGNPLAPDLKKLVKLRNAIAHKSDKAWDDFIKLVVGAPFNLTTKQKRGITPGRFIAAHNWGTVRVLLHSTATIRNCALHLVP